MNNFMREMSIDAPFDADRAPQSDINLALYRKQSGINETLAPEIIIDIASVLKSFHKGISIKIVLNTLIPKLAQVLTSSRIKYVEVAGRKAEYPNWYAINLMPSGFGKDRMLKDIDELVLRGYREWFNEQTEIYKEKRRQEIQEESFLKFPEDNKAASIENKRYKFTCEEENKIRNLVSEVSDGTREGLYQDAKAFSCAGFGGLFVRNSEFGSFLYNATQEQKLFLNMLNEAYSGKIISKSIKGEGREASIENIPVNVLFHADTRLFEKDANNVFEMLLETGFGRRCSIIMQYRKDEYTEEPDYKKALKAEEQYCEILKMLGRQFHKLFLNLKKEAEFQLTENGYSVFYQYRLKIKNYSENEENSLLCKEINSRELKALKLACIYACLNHPQELCINSKDMSQAVKTVEFLSSGFKEFLNYRPQYSDGYDRLFNFFLEHKNEKFNKTKLISEYYQLSGYSRDIFRARFDECIEIISDIAIEKGYKLIKESINHNSGAQYFLTDIKPEDLSQNLAQLENLI